jgi:HAMP domain-containing protein
MLQACKNLKLGAKLNLILISIFITAIALCGLLLSRILEEKIEQEVADKAFLIIETMNSVRNYTNTQVKPELATRLTTEDYFIPETVPAYSAREVFEDLRKQSEYQSFAYKEATLNPTNPRDQADQFETEITQKFRQNKELKEKTGFRSDNAGKFYYIARPLEIKKASCLECHDTVEKAPLNLVNTYGKEHGFGWKLNEIVASQIVSVPADDVSAAANRLKLMVLGIVGTIFLMAIAFINLFLKKSIIQPLKQMAILSNEISTGNMNLEFNHHSQDEIGTFAKSLNRMVQSLKMALEMIEEDDPG